jgi:hypothetical protein
MITLTKSNVPNFLQESDFYLSTEDENEEFSIPTDCFKKDVTVDNDNDLALLLFHAAFLGSFCIATCCNPLRDVAKAAGSAQCVTSARSRCPASQVSRITV